MVTQSTLANALGPQTKHGTQGELGWGEDLKKPMGQTAVAMVGGPINGVVGGLTDGEVMVGVPPWPFALVVKKRSMVATVIVTAECFIIIIIIINFFWIADSIEIGK